MAKITSKYVSIDSYFSYLGQYKWRTAIVLVSFMLSNALLAIIPVFIGKLVGALAATPVDSDAAWFYVAVLVACSTGHDLLWRLSELLYRYLYQPISYQYETLVFTQVIRKPYPFFVDKFTGKVSSYIKTLGDELRTFVERLFWDYGNLLVSFVSVAIIVTAINWQTGLIFIVNVLLMLIVGRYTVRNATKYEKAWADVQSTKNGKIIDIIANFVNVKSFRTEQREIQTVEAEQVKMIEAARRSFLWSIIFWGSLSFFVRNLMWPITIIFNVYLYLHGQLSLGELTTLLSAILIFTTFIWDIIWSISQFTLQLARIEEAHRYLFGPTNIIQQTAGAKTESAPTFRQQLTLDKLSFTYPDFDEAVLDNFSLQLKRGEKLGIVGKSGSGKTTLTKLLLGYYPVGADQLKVDDQTVSSEQMAKLIAYVPQDTSLFHRSIADNIAYAVDRQVSREAIIEAAKKAHAHEFVKQIPEQYDVLVGERGVKLSAGQRQRIAIARAFLDDKPILVLDEATSALDSESERLVQDALENLWHDKTVIAIAHRLSTLRNMDRIIVLSKGKIVEEGSHEKLLTQKGQYAKLWAHQSGGFIEDDSKTT